MDINQQDMLANRNDSMHENQLLNDRSPSDHLSIEDELLEEPKMMKDGLRLPNANQGFNGQII